MIGKYIGKFYFHRDSGIRGLKPDRTGQGSIVEIKDQIESGSVDPCRELSMLETIPRHQN